jgi:FdhD protein
MSMTTENGRAVRQVFIHQADGVDMWPAADHVAVEAPLEIRLSYRVDDSRVEKTICVTMRTPGQDVELVLGYLFAEGVIRTLNDVAQLPKDEARPREDGDVLTIELGIDVSGDLRRLDRNVFTSSSCGVCGIPSLDALAQAACPDVPAPRAMLDRGIIPLLPNRLYDRQVAFRQTGGLHAAALFDASGQLLRVREDVGRHNAMDKLIGSCLLDGVAFHDRIVLVSGRASYELVQKVLVAGVPILAAVGAPSSLAVSLAQAHGLTLIGFVRGEQYNIYHGEERFLRRAPSPAPSPSPSPAPSPAPAGNGTTPGTTA